MRPMTTHRPKDVAERLNIATPTLRLWSVKFARHLSPSAQAATDEAGKPLYRRYTDADLIVLRRAAELMGSGSTYEETDRRLGEERPAADPASRVELQASDDLRLAVAAMNEALRSKDQTIAAQQTTIATLQDALTTATSRADRLEAENASLHQQPAAGPPAANSEDVGGQDEPPRRGWWQRLTGR